MFFFFKQKTAYEIYQCDWSSDVCSSDLYNRYSNDVERLENRYDNFLEEFSSVLQRQAHD